MNATTQPATWPAELPRMHPTWRRGAARVRFDAASDCAFRGDLDSARRHDAVAWALLREVQQ